MRPTPIQLKRRVVFLHIAKTAGTSIVEFFNRRLPAGSVCSHGDFLKLPQDKPAFEAALSRFQFISGHMGYSDLAAVLPGAYSFTFLRDPVDRVLSFYKFCLHPDMQRQFAVARTAAKLGLEGFIQSTAPEVCEMLDNQQVWQLARNYWQRDRQALAALGDEALLELARHNLEQFDLVGLTENFGADFGQILRDLEIREPVPAKRQFRTVEPILASELSPATLSTLRERLGLDYALYEGTRRSRGLGGPATL